MRGTLGHLGGRRSGPFGAQTTSIASSAQLDKELRPSARNLLFLSNDTPVYLYIETRRVELDDD